MTRSHFACSTRPFGNVAPVSTAVKASTQGTLSKEQQILAGSVLFLIVYGGRDEMLTVIRGKQDPTPGGGWMVTEFEAGRAFEVVDRQPPELRVAAEGDGDPGAVDDQVGGAAAAGAK